MQLHYCELILSLCYVQVVIYQIYMWSEHKKHSRIVNLTV